MQSSLSNRRFTRRAHNIGIGMLELLLTTTVAGVLTAMASTASVDWVQRARMKQASENLSTDLRQARTEAVTRGVPIKLAFHMHPQGACYVIYYTSDNQACSCNQHGVAQCPASAVLLKSEWLAAQRGVQLHSNVSSVTFKDSDGLVTPAASIELATSRVGAVRHTISITGRVRRCNPAGASPGMVAC